MRKIFNLLLVTVMTFGFIGVVNAEESWSSITDDTSFLEALLNGESLEGNTAATTFFSKYDVYYQYQKIDDATYANYITDIRGETSTGAEQSINALIPAPSSAGDLGSWVKIDTPQISYADVEYTEGQKTGYIVAVAAVPKDDTSKVYVYRLVTEVTGSSKMESSYEINCDEDVDVVTDENTVTDTETVTEENPNTGISDYAIYLVPLALVGGVVLMMRKSFA